MFSGAGRLAGDTLFRIIAAWLAGARSKKPLMLNELLKKRLQRDRASTRITMRIPVDVVESLKALAPLKGFTAYQTLLKGYISEGLRRDQKALSLTPAQRTELDRRLDSHERDKNAGRLASEVLAELKKGKRSSGKALRGEYKHSDFPKGFVRGKYSSRARAGSNIVRLDPEIATAFPTSEAVNEALTAVLKAARNARLPKGR
jgi:putative addiction module component (TIGR02574 family)